MREAHGSPVWMQLSLAGLEGKCNKKMQIPTSPSDPPLVADLVLPGVLSAPLGEDNEGAPAQETLQKQAGEAVSLPRESCLFLPCLPRADPLRLVYGTGCQTRWSSVSWQIPHLLLTNDF